MTRKNMSSRTSRPRKRRGVTLCVVVTRDGTTVYANRAALRSIAEWMLWIATSDPTEHFELHVPWHLANHSRSRPNTWVLFDEEMRRMFVRRATGPDSGGPFELTFMHATNEDLDSLRRHLASKLAPRAWRQVDKMIKKRRSLSR